MNKYNSKSYVSCDGIKHPSKKQGKRWEELLLLQKARKIFDLQREVPFHLFVNEVMVCSYRADHVYEENGKQIVEDVKGFKTQVYNIKKKLMKAISNIEIREI